MKRQDLVGYLSGFMTGVLWAISGVFGQFLFEQRGIVPAWLVPIRLLSSGVLLFSYLLLTGKREELLWGLANAMGMVLNSILPEGLYRKYSTQVVMAWSFLFGGAALALLVQPWQYEVVWNGELLLAMFVIVVLGSVAAFGLYAVAVKLVGSSRASLVATSEPVAATVLSVAFLGTSFAAVDLVGFAMILSIVFLLTLTKQTVQS